MNTDKMTFEQLCELFIYTPKGRPLTNEEAAAFLQLKPQALDFKRFRGGGPRYFKPKDSRRVLYSERDLLEYLAAGARTSTSDDAAA